MSNFVKLGTKTTPFQLGKAAAGLMPKTIICAFIAPVDAVITAANRADDATFKAFLNARLHDTNEATRWQPVGKFEEFADLSEDSQYQTFGNTGTKVQTASGAMAWSFDVVDGGINRHISLQSYNGRHEEKSLFFVDSEGNFYATLDTEDTAGTQWKGFSLSILEAKNWVVATRSASAKFTVVFGFADATELNQNLCSVACVKFRPWTLKGVQSVYLEVVSSSGANVRVRVWGGGGAVNLLATNGTNWANVANFVATKASLTGAVLDIDTATLVTQPDPNNNYINLLLDNTDSDYASGTAAYITLASVSTVYGNVTGYFMDETGKYFPDSAKFTMG